MSKKPIRYHYVYRITNILLNKHYYGKRSSIRFPAEDLGVYYFSSSKDKSFIKDQKSNPQNYKYKVVSTYKTAKEAIHKEIQLHNLFNVGVNSYFYNRSKQTATGWDTTGIKPKYPSSNTGMVVVRDSYGNTHRVSINDPKYLSGEYQHHLKNQKFSDQVKQNISNGHKGHKHPKAVPVDLYDYYTDKLVASNIIINDWCKNTKYYSSHLYKTLRADRSRPHCSNSSYKERINVHHHKGIYAKHTT